MWHNFFGKVDIQRKNVSIPESRPKNEERYCKAYEARIKRAGLDIAVLGIGQNGHIGFNEPGTSFESRTHVAKLAKSTIRANSRFFKSEKHVPKKAITCGLKTIMRAKKIVVIAFGKKKARAVRNALEGRVSEKVPASIMQRHRNAVFVLDKEAASLLKKTRIQAPSIAGIRVYSDFNLPKKKRIAFFSPHPDDSAISAGALLSALTEKNRVFEIVLGTGHRGIDSGKSLNQKIREREKETRAEAKVLGTKPVFLRARFYDKHYQVLEADIRQIRALMRKIKPNLVFVPQRHDTHPAHHASRKIVLASIPGQVELWSYETTWALFGHEKFNAVFEFSKKRMRKKLKAIRKHKSQIERTRFDTAAESIAELRQIAIGEQFFSILGKKPVKISQYLELFKTTKW